MPEVTGNFNDDFVSWEENGLITNLSLNNPILVSTPPSTDGFFLKALMDYKEQKLAKLDFVWSNLEEK